LGLRREKGEGKRQKLKGKSKNNKVDVMLSLSKHYPNEGGNSLGIVESLF
jgi:hypothetical protein